MIPIKRRILSDRDFLFEPVELNQLGFDSDILAHLVDADTSYVQAINTTDYEMQIPARTKLGYIQKLEIQGCYIVDTQIQPLAANYTSSRKRWLAVGALVVIRLFSSTRSAIALGPQTEVVTLKGMIVYGISEV